MSAARTFAWEFANHHRRGFAAITFYILALTVAKLTLTVRPSETQFAFAVIVPFTSIVLYLLVVFSFGLKGDINARESLYPARYFTLPVTTHQLVFYPLLFGALSMLALWPLMRTLGLWPPDMKLPVFWPGLFAAVFLGWAQAFTWMPYGKRGMRSFIATAWLITVDTLVLVALFKRPPELLMALILAPQLPLVYLVAHYAVAAARRGHVPDWGIAPTSVKTRRLIPFKDAKHAQIWREWHESGYSIVTLVAIVVPFELLLLGVSGDSTGMVWEIVILVFVTAPFLAACTSRYQPAMTAFTATRPVTDREMVSAKFQTALIATIAAWLFVLAATAIGLTLFHKWTAIDDVVRYIARNFGSARAVALIALILAVFISATWRQLVQNPKLPIFVTLTIATLAIPVGDWLINEKHIFTWLWDNARWLLAALVVIKLSIAAFTTRNVGTAMTWLIAVLVLHAVLVWMLWSPFFPSYMLMLIAILVVPLVRVSTAERALGRRA